MEKQANQSDVVGLGFATHRKRTLNPMLSSPSCSESSSCDDGSGVIFCNSSAFTEVQWKELERQTMIYKYMLASVPVPPELVLPITTNRQNLPSSARSESILGFSPNSNPEPWRCRRTDGKKWRCSRDVAPDQKYCERHTHKGRPRSRKHVELQPGIITNNATNTIIKTRPHLHHPVDDLCYFPSSISSYAQPPRCLDWPPSNLNVLQPHSHLKFFADYNDGNSLQTRHLIDAWSHANRDNIDEFDYRCYVPAAPKPPFSSFSQNNDGTFGLERESTGDARPHWVSPDEWMSSPPGGPLAEALCLGIPSSSEADRSNI